MKELFGRHAATVPPERVLAILTDPESLRRMAGPGHTVDVVGPGVYATEVIIGPAAIGQRFPLEITVDAAPGMINLRATGQGRAVGMWLEAACALQPSPGGSLLQYSVRYEPGPLRLAMWSPRSVGRWVKDWLSALDLN